MADALRVLLDEIIDYAGLFPPAKLSLDESIRNYAAYRGSAEAWMLGRFIIPVARLNELDAYADLYEAEPPFRFSGLGRGGENADALVRGFDADLGDIVDAHRRLPGRILVDAFEVKLPDAMLDDTVERQLVTLDGMAASYTSSGLDRLRVALEVPPGSPNLGEVLSAVRTANDALGDPDVSDEHGFGPFLIKLRLGGVTAEAFPSVDTVAAALVAARDAAVPLKLTAGLHHPVRHRDAATGAMMHGFLNVYTAGAMAAQHALGIDDVASILAEEKADRFDVSSDAVSWGPYTASVRDLAGVRRTAVTSYGSCSFDEPREDLAELGLLRTYSKP